MTQSSEERVPESENVPSAVIIPFERQSELQRAVQQRAQERIEAQSVKPKVPTARRLVIFAVALIPVSLVFTGFVLAVHAVRVITSLYATPPAQSAAPAAEVAAPEPQQPGVVILVPEQPAVTANPKSDAPRK